jgi:two-component system sensor kinase FixL
LLEELRIVIEAALREEGIGVSWDIEPGLPAVWADRQSLMQVFLNLTKNSQRAMLDQPARELKIVARNEGHHVVVRVQDTGGGVLHPEHLFRPFQPGAQSTGLGVYLSRALLRSFRADLRYEPEPHGAMFVVELSPVLTGNLKESYGPGNPDSSGGRSQPVPGQPQPVVAD